MPVPNAVDTAFEIGAKMDDFLDGAKKEFATSEGAKQALKVAASKIEEHQKTADKELDEGLLSKEEHNIVKKYINQCGGIVRNLLVSAEIQTLHAQGKMQALEAAVNFTKLVHEREEKRLKNLANLIKQGDVVVEDRNVTEETSEQDEEKKPARKAGEHPGNPLADLRRRE